MRIPKAQFAIVAAEKLRDYLLDPSHRDGGSKAAFFGSLGYSRLAWRRFEADLRE